MGILIYREIIIIKKKITWDFLLYRKFYSRLTVHGKYGRKINKKKQCL